MAAIDPPSSPSPIVWDPDGPPRSRLYGDLYFSRDDGLGEARAVFLAGCGLPDRWAGRHRFVVGELGFGCGLNIAALLDLWLRRRPAGARLSIFSIEAHPITAEEAAQALAPWPQIAGIAALLTARWPGRAHGFHRIDFPGLHATLDVAVGPVAEALGEWTGVADAWFLDGFAPALNPDMWRPEILALVARRSAPGAALATYTVAGQVRRGLAAAGFTVSRQPGFGAKRERLEAHLPSRAGPSRPLPRVAIVGAGIAGASLARAFHALGLATRVFDAARPGASSGPAALVAPRLDAGLGAQAALFAQAFARAAALYGQEHGVAIAKGAVQLAVSPKDEARFRKIATSDLFEPGEVCELTADAAAERLGERTAGGLLIESGLIVEPAPLLSAWLGVVERAEVAKIVRRDGAWALMGDGGGLIAAADIVCVAAGPASAELAPTPPLTSVRGQASLARGVDWPIATLFGAYVLPVKEGVLFGATHDRGDDDNAPRAADHARNLAAVAAVLPALAERLAGRDLDAHAAVRAATSDYLPFAGCLDADGPGLLVLSGLGSRGFTLAPLLGEHVAALALRGPSPLPASLAALVDPGRFAARARRKGRPRP